MSRAALKRLFLFISSTPRIGLLEEGRGVRESLLGESVNCPSRAPGLDIRIHY
jgi:hypothetical protein